MKQPFDIRISELPNEFFRKRFETIVNSAEDSFVRFALLDFFVNALFDEDAFQRAKMQFVVQLALFDLQLALIKLHRLRRVLAQHLRSRHLDGPIVFDDRDAARDRDFAIRERIKRLDQLLRGDAGRRLQFDLNVLRSVIINAANLEFALINGGFDRSDQTLRGRARRNFRDDDCVFVLRLNFRANFN